MSGFLRTPNTYHARFKPSFGIPSLPVLPGETFDVNNDLTLSACGTKTLHSDGHVTNNSCTGDALLEYDKRHMTTAAFTECYGDDSEEDWAMLHGSEW